MKIYGGISFRLGRSIIVRMSHVMNGTNGNHANGSSNGTHVKTNGAHMSNGNGTHAESVENGSSKPKVLFVLGGPGAGKGTQCNNLVQNYGYVHLSAGDLLRAERNSGSKDGDMINECIKNGKIVAAEVTVRLLEKAMINNKGGSQKFLIDGFPRNESNLQGWVGHMNGKADVEGVLFFDCPEEVCVKRILERAKTSGRVDDNEESIRKRFNTYYQETMPVIKYYEKINLVKKINAVPDVDEVYQSVQTYLGEATT